MNFFKWITKSHDEHPEKDQAKINADQIEINENLLEGCKKLMASIDILNKRIKFLEEHGTPVKK